MTAFSDSVPDPACVPSVACVLSPDAARCSTSAPRPVVIWSAPAPPEPGTAYRNSNRLNTFRQLWSKWVTTTHRPPSRPTPAGGPPGSERPNGANRSGPVPSPSVAPPTGFWSAHEGPARRRSDHKKSPPSGCPFWGAAARSGVRGWGRGQTVAGLGWRAATAGAAVSQPTATVAASEAASSTDWSRCEYLCVVRSWA